MALCPSPSTPTPLYILGGLFWWIIFSPLLLFFAVVGGIWRLCAVISAKIFQPHLIPVSFKDSFFALYACEDGPLMSVGVTFRIKGQVETEAIMKKFKECFLNDNAEDAERYRNLYCYFQLYGGYVFKRPVEKLNLENHFLEKTLPRGTDPEDFLSKWIVTDTYKHKPEGQPCWQMVILRRGPEFDHEETTVSFKMHHGMMDGYSLVHMIDKLTGSKSPYIVKQRKAESIFTKIKHALEATAITWDVFIRCIYTEDLFTQGNPHEPEWTMSFSTLEQLQIVKDIRKKTKAKFATIMMSAITGALRRMYLQDKNYTVEQLPQQLWIESPVGLPNHPAMTKGGKFGNHFTAGIYATPLKTEDRVYRLEALEHDFYSFEKHSGLQVMHWILYGYYWLQPAFLLKRYTNYVSYLWRFAVLYSGLMTCPKKVSLVGQPVENIYFLQGTASAFPYVGLFLMCSTYAGKLDFSCNASRQLATSKQELERLVQVHLKEELLQMWKDYYEEKPDKVILAIEE